ncbi:hypothetical protein RM572_14080 [Streptomyces sp. DSM 42041]|uniref:Uncharacterized protein n=1 Tax=Streptomyces hazeniae TaxID=3075538 RepID=A0ABU2NSC9_9ACTN|nr:hypothetical protein [Streptomyces sp. DSM 42041]MDT0379889.1 hypothetical protein [Streptomyces sp. DSM 42041]
MHTPFADKARTPGPARHRRLPAVLWLVAVSVVLLAARILFGGDTHHDCAYLGPSLPMYVTAWAAPVASAAAWLLWGSAVRRGHRPTSGRKGRAAAAAVCALPLLLLAEMLVLYWTYAPDPAGGTGCSGLSAFP